MTTYQWDNADGSFVQVIVTKTGVTTRTQFGLAR